MRSPAGTADHDRSRVLVVAPQPFYEDRGTPIAVRQVLEALAELDVDVDLLTYPVGRTVEIGRTRVFRGGNPFRIASVPVGFSARKVVLDASLAAALWQRLRTGVYGWIHAVEELAFPALLLARRFGVRVIYDMQSSLPEQLMDHPVLGTRPFQAGLRACERWMIGRADFVVTSAGVAARVAALDGRVPHREWIFPAIPGEAGPAEVEALRAELALPPGAKVVVYSGTFASYQGLPLLLAAIPPVLALHPDVAFVLVGDTSTERLDPAALGEVPAHALRLAGRQPRERMPAFYALADLLVSPRSAVSNLPLKVFDYLIAGRPIVATDSAAQRYVLGDGRALLVEPTPVALAAGIARVLAEPELAAALAERARAYARTHLTWRGFVELVRSIYESVGLHA